MKRVVYVCGPNNVGGIKLPITFRPCGGFNGFGLSSVGRRDARALALGTVFDDGQMPSEIRNLPSDLKNWRLHTIVSKPGQSHDCANGAGNHQKKYGDRGKRRVIFIPELPITVDTCHCTVLERELGHVIDEACRLQRTRIGQRA